MNRPSLTITNEKESEFEFDVSIQGIPANEATVRFVIEGSTHDTTINCSRNANSKWMARIPSMRLDETAKNFRVEVIAGGYYFCPTQGAVKVVSNPTVIAEMVQRSEADKVSVSASFTAVEVAKPQMIMMEAMTPAARDGVLKRCQAAGKIFARAASLMQMPITEQRKVTSHTLVEILEAVKKAVKMVEVKVYL